ncbi:TagK domain-containing protein [Paraburkholderia sp. B3]|uniref:TagK domain-containing protein n=1 Tax=Paraburkholderia sp. B3 TaxID=3134791 RepID=UPI00398238C3
MDERAITMFKMRIFDVYSSHCLMNILRLLHRRELPVTRAEPRTLSFENTAGQKHAEMPEMNDGALLMFDTHQTHADLHGSKAIFGLIGSRPVMEPRAVSRTSTRVDGDDLIASLHRQYCQALDNPLGPGVEADWESTTGSERYARGDSGLPDDPRRPNAGLDSIEALLSGAQLLDHAFGPLKESDIGNLPESESVPEILRLFAPPEYLASAWRSMATLPPALARRDHHSPGIDSPLPMPQVSSTVDTP